MGTIHGLTAGTVITGTDGDSGAASAAVVEMSGTGVTGTRKVVGSVSIVMDTVEGVGATGVGKTGVTNTGDATVITSDT